MIVIFATWKWPFGRCHRQFSDIPKCHINLVIYSILSLYIYIHHDNIPWIPTIIIIVKSYILCNWHESSDHSNFQTELCITIVLQISMNHGVGCIPIISPLRIILVGHKWNGSFLSPRGAPKSSIEMGFYILNHPFGRSPIHGNHQICLGISDPSSPA